MKELMTYAAQAGVLAACSYLVYKAVFARDTLHRVRRFVLLGLLAASFALPVCRITVVKEVAATTNRAATDPHGDLRAASPVVPAMTDAEMADLSPLAVRVPRSFRNAALNISGAVYLAGVLALLVWRLAGIARTRRIMRRAVERYTTGDGVEVLLVDDNVPPFSFGGRIVMPVGDRESDGADMILRHETVHISGRHGWDLAAANIATTLLWFDPFVWLLRRELVLVHEIAADSGVIEGGFEAKKYQYLLISKVTPAGGLLPVATHFRTSDLHKRIVSMRKRTSRAAALKTLLLLPLAVIALAVFAQTRYVAAEPADEPATAAESAREFLHLPFDAETKITRRQDSVDYVDVTWTFPVGLFGKRIHPVTGQEFFHNGIDVVPVGDTVRAPYSGVVKSAALEDEMGNKLIITHADGLETAYGHLAGFLVSEGEAVKGGQPVAIVGNTGVSTGKHLHLETRVDGEPVNPLMALLGRRATPVVNSSANEDAAAEGTSYAKLGISIPESEFPEFRARYLR